ncbi:TPA: N-formylglutamate amidohydrolase [bacterium]|nr:N-formylglutamate amidohydrolase [bacterium]
MSKIIIHIPHDGDELPSDLMEDIIISKEEFRKYHNMMSDKDVSRLVEGIGNVEIVKFPISRLLCDVERFVNSDEIMEVYGMGFAYSHVYNGKQIRVLNDRVKSKVLKYYDEHHRILDETVLSSCEHIFFIDLHSFNIDATLPDLIDNNRGIPDICIGFDEGHCRTEILEIIYDVFKDAGYSVVFNYPYKGSLIPNVLINNKAHNSYDSFMIEINSNCYLDDNREPVKGEINKLNKVINNIKLMLERYK